MPEDDRLAFPDAPRSELEDTLHDLVAHAEKVLRTQGRLRHLLRANRVIVEQLDLDQVLHRIAEAAVELVDAEYGALGVISPDGGLERFLHVGIPDAEVARIGPPPRGLGLLGAVIDTAAPIRLAHLGEDPRSAGFPAAHPAMDAFLGVPIRVRDEVFGNLYLANPRAGAFTAEDEELVSSLAASAGIAIENARLYDATLRRERWSVALAEVTQALLSGADDNALAVIAERLAAVVGADLIAVVVPDDPAAALAEQDPTLRVEIARGEGGADLVGRSFARAGTLAERALSTGMLAASDGSQPGIPVEGAAPLGPTIALPLRAAEEQLGVLLVSRAVGAARFDAAELEMASDFASQAGVAIELSRARADRERLRIIDDRSRIARDLHDHVIQRLFGSGLALQAVASRHPEVRESVHAQVEAIDAAIAEIRTAIFALAHDDRGEGASLRRRVLDVVAESTPALGLRPRVSFAGPIDLHATGALADDVVAVVRETLANVARHAAASEVELALAIEGDRLAVTVDDDGVGVDPGVARASGLANLRERALAHGGDFTLEARDDGGTRARWTAEIAEEEGTT
ncbi:MAG: GAF domain-containing protein [Actinomycetales bacterium]|nr:GAF domain-containing protein [Actinomycetales bacterium]